MYVVWILIIAVIILILNLFPLLTQKYYSKKHDEKVKKEFIANKEEKDRKIAEFKKNKRNKENNQDNIESN